VRRWRQPGARANPSANTPNTSSIAAATIDTVVAVFIGEFD
jgi:hypothetical protein